MDTLPGIDIVKERDEEKDGCPREGTRLTPSDIESIYHALTRADIDILEEEPRVLTAEELARIEDYDLEREQALRVCDSICHGYKLQKVFELSLIMFIARAMNQQHEMMAFGSPAYDERRYLHPQNWLINALYPTRNGGDQDIMMEAYAATLGELTGNGPASHLDLLKQVFLEWHRRHTYFAKGKKRRNGSEGSLLSADEVELLWYTPSHTSPSQRARAFAGEYNLFPVAEGDFEMIMELVHRLIYVPVQGTSAITWQIERIRSVRDIAFEPSVQISIHRNGGDRDESNTILARTDLVIMNRGENGNNGGSKPSSYPISQYLLDLKTGSQMLPERLKSELTRITALAYGLSYYFSRGTWETNYGSIPIGVIEEDAVHEFLARVAHRAVPGEGERRGTPGIRLDYLHLPSGNIRNIFPGAFLDPDLYDLRGRSLTSEDVRHTLEGTYQRMNDLFGFARLNKQVSRFWRRSYNPFVLPRPCPASELSQPVQRKLFFH